MKRIVLLLSLFIVYCISIPAHDDIINLEKSFQKNNEIDIGFTDRGSNYYFYSPLELKVGSDGCIFIKDINQILKFSPEGHFLKTIFKIVDLQEDVPVAFDFILFDNRVIIYDLTANKVIRISQNGHFISEKNYEFEGYDKLIGELNDDLIFLKIVPPDNIKKPGIYESIYILFSISKDGKKKRKIYAFPVKKFYVSSSKSPVDMIGTPFNFALSEDGRYLFISDTQEYQIKMLDLVERKVIRRFDRKYIRVKHIKSLREKEFYELYNQPEKEYENDIKGLYVNKNLLWIKTSTIDKEKGVLFDVFDFQGSYLEKFYINMKGIIMTIYGDFVFAIERDTDGKFQIHRYRIQKKE